MEVSELKEKCRKIIVDHLTSKGYPNLSRRGILNELQPMWIKMEEAGLMEDIKALGWTYQKYHDRAIKVVQESAIFEALGKFVRANPRRVK